MILWVDGAHDPRENMRRDRALLAAAEGGAEPVLRIFRFDPPGITLGRTQDAERELDLSLCAADGVPWAVRPTGGRAIFHDQEWTYSLAAPLDDPGWGGSLSHSYRRASELIVRSLRTLGVPATLVPAREAVDPGPRAQGGPAPPCFASTARHEVVVEGRKLVGSAQRRTSRALLQQGSVLLGPGHSRIADYLRADPEAREETRRRLALVTHAAGAWIPADAPLLRWADALSAAASFTGRVEAAAGLFLLTLEKRGSYTPAFAQGEV